MIVTSSPTHTASLPPIAAEPPAPPEPAALPLPTIMINAYGEQGLRDSIMSAGKSLFDGWIAAAAHVVLSAVLADVRSGAVGSPQLKPHEVEAALAARADQAAAESPHLLDLRRRRDGIAAILAYAECGPAGGPTGWPTPITPFVDLAVSTGEGDRGAGAGSGAPAGLCVLRPGSRHEASAVGFDATIRWDDYAQRVLRNDVLRTVARRAEAESELLLTSDLVGGPHALPCRVRTAVPQALFELRDKRRDRRR